MVTSVNAGGRLDRLPIGPFHRRIMMLIGIGMFFDGFDIYLAGTVLGVTLEDRLLHAAAERACSFRRPSSE